MFKILNKLKALFGCEKVIVLASQKKDFVAQTGGNYCGDVC